MNTFFSFSLNVEILRSSRFSCGNWACQDPFFHHAKFLLYIKSESHQPDSFCHRQNNQLIIRYFKSPIEICIKGIFVFKNIICII